MTINEFYKIIKSWLSSNVVTFEIFDRKFYLYRIDVVQNNLILNSIKEMLILQWYLCKKWHFANDKSLNTLCLKTYE